jgi:hypothetical protein
MAAEAREAIKLRNKNVVATNAIFSETLKKPRSIIWRRWNDAHMTSLYVFETAIKLLCSC